MLYCYSNKLVQSPQSTPITPSVFEFSFVKTLFPHTNYSRVNYQMSRDILPPWPGTSHSPQPGTFCLHDQEHPLTPTRSILSPCSLLKSFKLVKLTLKLLNLSIYSTRPFYRDFVKAFVCLVLLTNPGAFSYGPLCRLCFLPSGSISTNFDLCDSHFCV